MPLQKQIKKLASEYTAEITNIRRHLHEYPELSFQEYQTAKFVAKKLRQYGIEPTEGVATTGLTALIEGQNSSKKVVALRADMDALPIKEANEVPYKSKNEGIMHACGHDVHTASLLGAAKILHEIKDQFEGTVKLIFQPGEERFPGGASLMIKDGVLEDPVPSSILGLHVMPFLDVGKVGFREGMYMASADEIYITVKGKGGHAATPHLNIDPVIIASHIMVALQQIVSRQANPNIPSVLSFGKVIAEGATNIIPDEVKIEGTFRTLNEPWRKEAKLQMERMAESIAVSMGGSCDFKILDGYPYLENHPELTRRVKSNAIKYLGRGNVEDLDIWMAGEDFSYFSHRIDASFYRLGVRNESKGITSSVHTPTFDIDERALGIGAGLMAWLAVNELSSN